MISRSSSQLVLAREEPVEYFPFTPPEPLLLPPVEYQPVWDDRNTGAKFGDVTLWRSLPPAGYVCLGHTASIGNRKSATPGVEGYFVCVNKSIVVPGSIHKLPVYSHTHTLSHMVCCCSIDPFAFGSTAFAKRHDVERPRFRWHV